MTVGLDARGFLLAPTIAQRLGADRARRGIRPHRHRRIHPVHRLSLGNYFLEYH